MQVLNEIKNVSLQVCEDEWTETIEHDLCTLWDMTAEKDIVKFLLENDFYNIALLTLKVSEEPRLTVGDLSKFIKSNTNFITYYLHNFIINKYIFCFRK